MFPRFMATWTIRSWFQQHLRPAKELYKIKLCARKYSINCRDFGYSTRRTRIVTPLFLKALDFGDRVAIIDQNGSHTYDDILCRSERIADKLSNILNTSGEEQKRIAFLGSNDVSYVVAQWATWMSGSVAVPLFNNHPRAELEYVIRDSGCSLVIVSEDYSKIIQSIAKDVGIECLILRTNDYLCYQDLDMDEESVETLTDTRENRLHQSLAEGNRFKHQSALIVYTSGTTGRPKGAIHTHGSLQAQMEGMIQAWSWQPSDVILHVLPLHHVHGIVNVLMTPLFSGATCYMLPKFNAKQVWSTLLSPVTSRLPRSINVFMAVPTIYAKLIEDHEQRFSRGRGTKRAKEFVRAVCTTKLRLMVSGSAALPEPIMRKWEDITGHRLLERYGMTELGMGLTNPIKGPRIAGTVGKPFPSVEVCIAKPNVYSKNGYDVIAKGNSKRTRITKGLENEAGDLYVRGPSLFKEYWNRPDSTQEAFTKDGWFKTGDTACYTNGVYKILGRTSVDIIKSGGYKISALDIERHLLTHSEISEVSVVGLPDITWGQKVAAIVVLKEGTSLTLPELKNWCKERMPAYHIPTVLKTVPALQRNSMGKINKKDLLQQLYPKEMKQVQ